MPACPICSLFVYGVLVAQNHIVWFVQSSQAGYFSVLQLGVNRAQIRGAIVTPGVVSTGEMWRGLPPSDSWFKCTRGTSWWQ